MTDHPTPIASEGEEAHPLDGKLEPEARDTDTPTEAALISLAVSMKRIADVLDVLDVREGPTALEQLRNALQDGIGLGAQGWIGHMARSGR